jgi:hypothetical protein
MTTPPSLREEIDAITAGRMEVEREHPGFFWDSRDDGGRKLTRDEARVFAITYEEFPRMVTVREAWLDFLGLTFRGPLFHSPEAIALERTRRPELTAGDEPEFFTRFATEVGGLTRRQAEAMYWKDWFWTVRNAGVRYADERT